MLDNLREFFATLPPLSHPVWYLGIFTFGACVGSYLNVFIYRWPRELSTISPGSHCFSCDKPIKWYDNLPILSYFILGGKCRNCKASYSIRYAMVELLVALLFTAVWWKYHHSPAVMGVYLVVVGALVAGSLIDLDTRLLPNRITMGGILLGPIAVLFIPELMDSPEGQFLFRGELGIPPLARSLVGLAVGYYVISFVTAAGELTIGFLQKQFNMMSHIDLEQGIMGYGDFKLLAAAGAVLGWKAAIWTLFAGSFVGALVGGVLIFTGRRELGTKIPFGPYLAIAILWWIFGGSDLLSAYLKYTLFRGQGL